MKSPPPIEPNDVPAGTVQLGGPIGWFSASLQVSGADLKPEEVTELLGAQPTEACTRDVPLLREDGSVRRIPRSGQWAKKIKPAETDEWDISEVIRLLFVGLTGSIAQWQKVGELGRLQVSLGLSLRKGNEDFSLEAELMQFLADRGVGVWFDVYGEQHEV